MITEDYVSFEIAKLLKEKGFDEPCKVWYSEYTSQFGGEKYTRIEFDDHNRFKKDYKFLFHTPTHQMAVKWLRKIYGIDIVIEISDPSVKDRKYYCVIWNKNNDSYILDLFSSYEECVEAALKYCLENLI